MPFWFSSILWPLIFFALAPLFYGVLRYQTSFLHGYAWGFFVFLFHVSGFVQSLFYMANGSNILLATVILAIIAYLALYAGLWFLVTHFLIKIFSIKDPILTISLWLFTAILYLWCIDHICLWPFLRVEGYPFIHPLIPLATHPQFLWLLPVLGKIILTLLLLINNATIAYWFVKKNRYSFVFMITSFLPWIVFFYSAPSKQNPPAWLAQIVPLQIQFPPSQPNHTIMHTLYRECLHKYSQQPDAQLIVLPESAICQSIDSIDLTSIKKLPDLLIGSLCINKNHTFNTLYWIHNGTIINKYCKRHTLFFTEQLPWWCNSAALDSLLFSESGQRTIACNQRPLLTIADDIVLVPYLCSELFFNHYPDDIFNHPIIALCNDWWFSVNYPAQLMFLAAKLKAIEWQRSIIYISYFYAHFIDTQGYTCNWLDD